MDIRQINEQLNDICRVLSLLPYQQKVDDKHNTKEVCMKKLQIPTVDSAQFGCDNKNKIISDKLISIPQVEIERYNKINTKQQLDNVVSNQSRVIPTYKNEDEKYFELSLMDINNDYSSALRKIMYCTP